MNRYRAADHVREHMMEAADEGAIFITKLLRGQVEASKPNLALAQQARGAMGAYSRYEATLSAREQTSVIISKMLAGDSGELRAYIAAAMPDHPVVRSVLLPAVTDA